MLLLRANSSIVLSCLEVDALSWRGGRDTSRLSREGIMLLLLRVVHSGIVLWSQRHHEL